MIAIPIPIQTPHAPVFDFLFFHLATSRGNPGGFWIDLVDDNIATAGSFLELEVSATPAHTTNPKIRFSLSLLIGF